MGMRECMRDVPGEVSGAANFHEMGGELCCECDREMWELRGELGGGGGWNWGGVAVWPLVCARAGPRPRAEEGEWRWRMGAAMECGSD
jgi:hypothetical protein